MNRREALLNSLRLIACTALPKTASALLEQPPQPALPPLKTAGACFGAHVGIAAAKASLQDPSFARVVVQNFNLITASGMKWNEIHPGPDSYDFAEGDWNMRFAEENGLEVHGHNLCWNSPANYPAWFKTVLNKGNAEDFLTGHITTIMKRYQGRISSWDVVNEPVVPWPGRSDGLYPGIWLDLLGPEYIDIAFRAAVSADPKPLRILNIHHVEQGIADDELNRGRALALLKQLLARGVPVQAVGIESHLNAAQPLAAQSFRQFISEIRALKLQVLVTELDVKETRAVGNSLAWDETVAKYYGDYLAEVVPAANPRFVIFWTVKDRWEGGDRIQGLMQNNLSPRLTYAAAIKALQIGSSCDGRS